MSDTLIDYCDAKKEMEKNPDAKAWIAAAANGDQNAYDFLWRFWCFAHCYDDLLDRDNPKPMELGVRELIHFIGMLSFNPFYLKHKDSLFALLVQACNRWIDGEEWENSDDPEKRAAAHVVRCGDLEVYTHVAFLTGGWNHMRSLSGLRTYDKSDDRKLRVINTKGA